MKVELDYIEMLYLLESCLRGSHLRAMTVRRFCGEFWERFTDRQRISLYRFVVQQVYGGTFTPRDSLCGADVMLMEMYDPDNQYIVSFNNGKGMVECVRAFLHAGNRRYYTNSSMYIAPDAIVSIEKLILDFDEEKDS